MLALYACLILTLVGSSDGFTGLARVAQRSRAFASSPLQATENKAFADSAYAQFNKVTKKAFTTAAVTFMIGNLLGGIPQSAQAAPGGWFPSSEQKAVNEISTYQRPIYDILEQLTPSMIPNTVGVYSNTQLLKGGKEDADVVANYMENFIKPCQQEMEKLAVKLPLSAEDKEKATTYAQLMKGHILELQQAIKSQKTEEQRKEVQEVQETLADYLKLISVKYEVEPYMPPRPVTDKELFGPLGCEFWGKKRVPGSNACQPIE